MKGRWIFVLSALGIIAALIAAYYFGFERKAQPPVFEPVSSPYPTAIYANGIVESEQGSGSNVNIYPEVSGTVARVLVHENQRVTAGTPLLMLDDSVQRATAEQLRLQAEAALALLNELKAQPRPETLAIARSQVELAESNLRLVRDQLDKRQASFAIDPRSISSDLLDTAKDSVKQAEAALDVAQRQLALTQAGAWQYDIQNQQKQYEALSQSYQAARSLLGKFTLTAQVDGVVLAVNAPLGGYVTGQGVYDPYTQAQDPLVVMSSGQDQLAVRCYVDEILVSRLPGADRIQAQMSLRGTDVKLPLEFVRIQPFISPKIELSDQRQEKVDLRVLPVIFRFHKPAGVSTYPGQLVDVYIGTK